MTAEIANYRSWIAWVPILALLSIPFLFRRALPVGLAIGGAFLGLIAAIVVPPLGRDAEQLGPNVAIGLVIGAMLGAITGLVIQGLRTTAAPRDRSVTVLGSAIGLGVLGMLVGGLGPSVFGGRPDLEVTTLGTIAIGGGLGWSVGVVIGWRRVRSSTPPDRVQRWALGVAAVAVALFGWTIIASIHAGAFGPSIDTMTRHDRRELPVIAALYHVDTMIAMATLVALASWRPQRGGSTIPAPAIASPN